MTDPQRGNLDVRVRVRRSGMLRLEWRRPGTREILHSCPEAVRVR
jgi:hypothetical protein